MNLTVQLPFHKEIALLFEVDVTVGANKATGVTIFVPCFHHRPTVVQKTDGNVKIRREMNQSNQSGLDAAVKVATAAVPNDSQSYIHTFLIDHTLCKYKRCTKKLKTLSFLLILH